MKVKIIINADDFGRSIERNQAIDDSFNQGLIQSAGLIVTGKHLQNAVDYINKGGYVEKIHLHLNLSTSMRDGDSEDIPLTKAMRSDSFFCKDGRFRPYKGLPINPISVFKWKLVYNELVAQYNKFKEITNGKADYKHVDFHLWYNLTWSVSVALNVFTRRYKIESVRYISMRYKSIPKYNIFRVLSWNPRVKSVSCSSIDFYLTKCKSIKKDNTIELYCHPNYKDGVLLDDTPSLFQHDRQPLSEHIQKLNELENLEFVAWEDVC